SLHCDQLSNFRLCLAAGAEIVRDPEPVHGRASLIHHEGHFLFSSLESPFEAARYHSLHAARPVPSIYEEIAWTTDDATGERDSIMAIAHRELPRYGAQFHPESILSPNGASVIHSFLCGLFPREASV
ncbi:MAG: aminodeoxychorismate/anthranilate synthase component II, partial [Planctomycetota bacterium]